MQVQTARFGMIEVPEDKIIRMQKPILGFERLSVYCLVENDEFRPFLWLQSLEDPQVAFIVVNPVIFFEHYRIEVHSKELADLMITDAEQVETYVIVTIPEDPRRMSVNLQGPILINTENNRAKQVVLVNSDYHVKHYVFDAIKAVEEDEPQTEKEMLVEV